MLRALKRLLSPQAHPHCCGAAGRENKTCLLVSCSCLDSCVCIHRRRSRLFARLRHQSHSAKGRIKEKGASGRDLNRSSHGLKIAAPATPTSSPYGPPRLSTPQNTPFYSSKHPRQEYGGRTC